MNQNGRRQHWSRLSEARTTSQMEQVYFSIAFQSSHFMAITGIKATFCFSVLTIASNTYIPGMCVWVIQLQTTLHQGTVKDACSFSMHHIARSGTTNNTHPSPTSISTTLTQVSTIFYNATATEINSHYITTLTQQYQSRKWKNHLKVIWIPKTFAATTWNEICM